MINFLLHIYLKFRQWLLPTKYKTIHVYSDDNCRTDTEGGPYKVLIKKK